MLIDLKVLVVVGVVVGNWSLCDLTLRRNDGNENQNLVPGGGTPLYLGKRGIACTCTVGVRSTSHPIPNVCVEVSTQSPFTDKLESRTGYVAGEGQCGAELYK
jgi:hypothetical protein